MGSKVNEVLKAFSDGFYCSQAILSTYCEELGLDKEAALKISCGLAAGIARLGLTCGYGCIYGNQFEIWKLYIR